MADPAEHNKALVQLRAAILARRAALILGAGALFTGDYMGAVIMAIVWALLYFALPVTH